MKKKDQKGKTNRPRKSSPAKIEVEGIVELDWLLANMNKNTSLIQLKEDLLNWVDELQALLDKYPQAETVKQIRWNGKHFKKRDKAKSKK